MHIHHSPNFLDSMILDIDVAFFVDLQPSHLFTKTSQSIASSPHKIKANNYIHEFELARLFINYGTVALFKA